MTRTGVASMFLLVVLGGLLLLPPDSDAGFHLYGSSSSGSGSGGPSSFYEIDIATGDATLIDTIGFRRVGAMATHPSTGVIYATGERNDGFFVPVLITIDPVTGLGTEVGETGIQNRITDLDFRSDGKLFANLSTNQGGDGIH